VLSVRADFYGHCAAFPELTAALQDAVPVGPMSTVATCLELAIKSEAIGDQDPTLAAQLSVAARRRDLRDRVHPGRQGTGGGERRHSAR
jgi:hypothetical protein